MTQYPGYVNPYLTPSPAPNTRPTSVTVVAIIGIIWGVLMLLCNGIAMVSVFIPANFAGPNPAAEEMRSNTVAHGWSIASPVIGFILAFTLLAGSGGALSLQSWARAAMNLFALVEILIAIVHTAITIIVINPIISRNLQYMTNGPGGTAPSQQMMSAIQHGGVILTAVIALSFPIVVLIVMNTKTVKDAFAAKRAGGMSGGIPTGQSVSYGATPPPGQPPYSPPPG